jgi:hypothetical protein
MNANIPKLSAQVMAKIARNTQDNNMLKEMRSVSRNVSSILTQDILTAATRDYDRIMQGPYLDVRSRIVHANYTTFIKATCIFTLGTRSFFLQLEGGGKPIHIELLPKYHSYTESKSFANIHRESFRDTYIRLAREKAKGVGKIWEIKMDDSPFVPLYKLAVNVANRQLPNIAEKMQALREEFVRGYKIKHGPRYATHEQRVQFDQEIQSYFDDMLQTLFHPPKTLRLYITKSQTVALDPVPRPPAPQAPNSGGGGLRRRKLLLPKKKRAKR